jgi:hypothetical protein
MQSASGQTIRVTFEFDERSLESVHKMVAQRRCVGVRPPAKEVVVTNPVTGQTRVIFVPAAVGAQKWL